MQSDARIPAGRSGRTCAMNQSTASRLGGCANPPRKAMPSRGFEPAIDRLLLEHPGALEHVIVTQQVRGDDQMFGLVVRQHRIGLVHDRQLPCAVFPGAVEIRVASCPEHHATRAESADRRC